MSANPAFISAPRIGVASLSAANTAIDGTGTITTLLTGVAAGTRILEIATQSSATSAAALVNVFVSSDGGTTWKLFDQISISAATPSTTVKGNRTSTTYTNLVLTGTSSVVGITITIAQATQVWALGGDLT
jgi:hypothetical protein